MIFSLHRLLPSERALWLRGLRAVRRLPPTRRARVPARVELQERIERWAAVRSFLWWFDHPLLFVRVKLPLFLRRRRERLEGASLLFAGCLVEVVALVPGSPILHLA